MIGVGHLCTIQLLGGLQIFLPGRSIRRYRTRKTAALLAYLAFHLHRSHCREELAERFWPESEPEAGRACLRTALASLRRQLEPPGVPAGAVLIADRSHAALNPATVAVDAVEFLAALARAGRRAEPRERVDDLTRAVELYRGELLPGCFEEWALDARDRLAQAAAGALAELAGAWEGRGELARAIDCRYRAVALDSLNEALHAELIQLLLRAGEPSAAARQYRLLERRLREELGAAPDPALAERMRPHLGSAAPGVPRHGGIDAGRRARSRLHDPAPGPLAARLAAPAPERGRPSPLPLQLTRFFGREEELACIEQRLCGEGVRILTLTGPGGAGKTRLAAEAGRRLTRFGDAVWFVPLAELADARLILTAVAEAVGAAPIRGADPLEGVSELLGGAPALLILDNFEHLVEEGALVVRRLLERLPTAACLVTSRQRLNLEGEQELVVDPLPVPAGPDTPARLLGSPSVQLFVDRAQAARPDFQLTERNAAAIAALCACLEGVPLALELAAARASTLTAEQMLDQLSRKVDFLVSRRRDVAPRHRTLRTAILWSYDALPAELRGFFVRLAVFRGSWTLDAAQEVCDEPAALEYLAELRDRSLIRAAAGDGAAGAELRYTMLEMLRQFAGERLTPETEAGLRRRHAGFYSRLAREAHAGLTGARQAEWLARLEAEHDNLRAALGWSLEHAPEGALELAVALSRFWEIRGHIEEAAAWLRRVLERHPEPTLGRAEALELAATFAWFGGNSELGQRQIEESLRIHRALGSSAVAGPLICRAAQLIVEGRIAAGRELLEEALAAAECSGRVAQQLTALENLSRAAMLEGHYAEAARFARRWHEQARAIGDHGSVVGALTRHGIVLIHQGEHEHARALFVEAGVLAARLGERRWAAGACWGSSVIALLEGDCAAAREHLRQTLLLIGAGGYEFVRHYALEVCAYLAALEGRARCAARLLGLLDHLRASGRVIASRLAPLHPEPYAAMARAALGDREYERAYASGVSLTLRQALAEAQRDLELNPGD